MLDIDLLELFKTFPICMTVLIVIPVAFLTSPATGSHEFKAFRMQHYDLHGVHYGSRSALVNMEARPITAGTVTRRCIVVKIGELAYDRFKEILEQGAGSILILLPRNISRYSVEQIQQLQELEEQMIQEEIQSSVYFAQEDAELLQIYEHIGKATTSDQAGSAVEALFDVASTSGYQVVASTSEAKQIKDLVLTNIQGRLVGDGIDEQLPTIAIVTHYDSFGIAPGLTTGADANASGVVALLEIARIFSRLYNDELTRGKYNIVFLLSGGGKFNYLGTRKWLEDQMDSPDYGILNEVDYVLCLDSIGGSNQLFMHVSKPPKENTPGFRLVEAFKKVGELYPDVNFTLVHKKVNLAEELVAWEHERFSIRRLPAGTLSHFSQPKEPERVSMFQTKPMNSNILEKHIKFIAEAIARHVYNTSSKVFRNHIEIFNGGMSLHMEFVKTWLSHLTMNSRAVQFITKNHPLLKGLELHLTKHIKEVKRIVIKADKRDPDFVFYDALETTMFAYRVKPAIFDLFLAAGIACYIALFYFAILNFPVLIDILPKPAGVLKCKYT